MKKYVFRIYTTYEPEDGFNAWVIAESPQRAQEKIMREYHSIDRVVLMYSEKVSDSDYDF